MNQYEAKFLRAELARPSEWAVTADACGTYYLLHFTGATIYEEQQAENYK